MQKPCAVDGTCLNSLAFIGGPTPTLGLPTGSPAAGQIPPNTLSCGVLGTPPAYTPSAFDQRGVARPQGPNCSIGAVEHLLSNLPTSSTTCNGIYNKSFDGDITVLPGQKCVFLEGGITGNVQVKGGSFEVRYATVGGGVEIDHGSSFSIGPSATIAGNLEIHNLEQGPAQNRVCGAAVQGSLDVHNNDAAIVIGAQDQTSCAGNKIGGSVEVHNNNASTSIDANNITGDLKDHNKRRSDPAFLLGITELSVPPRFFAGRPKFHSPHGLRHCRKLLYRRKPCRSTAYASLDFLTMF